MDIFFAGHEQFFLGKLFAYSASLYMILFSSAYYDMFLLIMGIYFLNLQAYSAYLQTWKTLDSSILDF